ncbi:hypothetical protein B0H13DRAFT_1863797 [Mycena leptocephala]|nr:hypothetical protein B0H13DRAFT_1863797 [Mycena leptocephala]
MARFEYMVGLGGVWRAWRAWLVAWLDLCFLSLMFCTSYIQQVWGSDSCPTARGAQNKSSAHFTHLHTGILIPYRRRQGEMLAACVADTIRGGRWSGEDFYVEEDGAGHFWGLEVQAWEQWEAKAQVHNRKSQCFLTTYLDPITYARSLLLK